MGRDKATLPVDGVPMALRVARAVEEAGATAVMCIGGDRERLAKLGLEVVPDEHPDEGPLAGAITGLARSRESITVVTPCDLVEPRAEAFERLVTTLTSGDADVAVAVPIVDGAWRALPAVFRTSCLPDLQAAYARGERSIHKAVAPLRFVAVEAGPLADADSPEELRAAGRVVGG
jgi:molybdopterin-guanine dinucleotide biosynthesis protein A